MGDSILTRAMKDFDLILGEQNKRETGKARPDPFISTRWMLAEIDEAMLRQTNIIAELKHARAGQELAEAARLCVALRTITHQIHQMAMTAATVFVECEKQQEAGNAG